MKRIMTGGIVATLLLVASTSAPATAFVAPPWLTMLQSQQISRWQPDRFGPIVATDTMWTIASYYGRQHGLTVYEMMDAIVAANPKVFINNRPDLMMDGYYLVIPQRALAAGSLPQQSQQQQSEQQVQQQSEQSTAQQQRDVIEFDAAELRDLRDRLSGSIAMIEALQNENAQLQQRLNSVTAELEALKAQLAEDRVIDAEIDALAAQLAQQNPQQENSEARLQQQVEQATEPPAQAQVEQAQQTQSTTEVMTANQRQQRRQPDFLQWLRTPPQLYLAIAIPIVLLLLLIYAWYSRRVTRQIEQALTEAPPNTPAEDAAVAPNTPAEDAAVAAAAGLAAGVVGFATTEHEAADAPPEDDAVRDEGRSDDALSDDLLRDEPLLWSTTEQALPTYVDDSVENSFEVDAAALDDGLLQDAERAVGSKDDQSLDFDLSAGATERDYLSIDELLQQAEVEAAQQTNHDSSELVEQSIDESKTPAARLDLAQAYIDMGELDDARALLQKIVGCDDAEADREARQLLQQLDGQGGR